MCIRDRSTVERVKTEVAAQQYESLGLDPVSAEQHPYNGRLQVVIADAGGHTPKAFKGIDVTGEERLLGLGRERSVTRSSR